MEFTPESLFNHLCQDLGLSEALPLTSDITLTNARKSALISSIFKKWVPDDPEPLEQVAVAKFKACNELCVTSFRPDEEDYRYETLVDMRDFLFTVFNSGDCQSSAMTLNSILNSGRAGPGASLGTKKTDFLGKMFESKLTSTTGALYKHYRTSIAGRWKVAESFREFHHGSYALSVGSKLSSVPKNAETNRTICTEPSLNMFYQLGAGREIEGLLKRFYNIDLSLQPDINREMAQIGSKCGKFATIDLKSASDTISTKLVRYLLPKRTYELLDSLRSKITCYGDEVIELSMFSSMGNGFTFPLQTLLFATLVRSVYRSMGITPCSHGQSRNYSVFGDDIICLSEAYYKVCQMLSYCGFLVNDEKSFASGAFRESCGSDFLQGHDIRAVFLKEIKNESQVYSAFNRIARWSAKYSINTTSSLLYLKGLVKFRPVPLDAADTAGFKLPLTFVSARKCDANGALYYSGLSAEPRRRFVGGDYSGNPNGAIVCFIGGYVRDHHVGIRNNQPTWRVKRFKTPCWDNQPLPGFTTDRKSVV